MRTILAADQVIAFQHGEHRHLRDGLVVVEGARITHVGPRESLPDVAPGEIVELGDALLAPGFIDAHAHLTSAPLDRTVVEDVGEPQFQFTALAEILPAMALAMDREAERAMAALSILDLLRSGTTTVMEIGWGAGAEVADLAEQAGLRAWIANGYGSARWGSKDGKRVSIDWRDDEGLPVFEAACRFVEDLKGRADGRLNGFLSPMQVAMATPRLLAETREAAERLDCPVALHVSEAIFEWREMVAREGMTPLEWLDRLGFLSERCMLGHVIFTAGHSALLHPGRDLEILAASGASVAHCPWVFGRRGYAMESFARYRDAGVTMCLGSDTAPQSILTQMRLAAAFARLHERSPRRVTSREMFEAATLAPARVLGRDDLGRIAPGAKADLCVWRLDGLSTAPCRDPVRMLVWSAEPEDLSHVMIDGRWVVRDRVALGLDRARIVAEAREAAARVWDRVGPGDWAGRRLDALAPPSLEAWR